MAQAARGTDATQVQEAPTSYAEFWPYYLRAHSRAGTRRLHYLGTALGTIALVAAVARRDWRFVPLALAAGYAPAWIGHLGIERNRPATFGHPMWSFISDCRMAGLALSGRLGRELRRAGAEGP